MEEKKAPSVEVKISADDMFRFNLYHVYTHPNGWLTILIGVIAIVVGFTTYGSVTSGYTLMYFVLGTLLIAYQPFMLHSASKKQVEGSEVLSKPLIYTFLDEGIQIHTELEERYEDAQEETEAEAKEANGQVTAEEADTDAVEGKDTQAESGTSAVLKWNQVYKAVKNRKQLLVYSGRASAYILPIDQLGDQEGAVEEVLREKLAKFRRKGF
jgi:membrane-bound ClpP family serine protease